MTVHTNKDPIALIPWPDDNRDGFMTYLLDVAGANRVGGGNQRFAEVHWFGLTEEQVAEKAEQAKSGWLAAVTHEAQERADE